MYVHDPDIESLRTFVRTELGRDSEEVLVTAAERLLNEGHAKGHAEGRLELVTKLVALKFGPITPELDATLRRLSPTGLDGFAERMLTATTLEEALG